MSLKQRAWPTAFLDAATMGQLFKFIQVSQLVEMGRDGEEAEQRRVTVFMVTDLRP